MFTSSFFVFLAALAVRFAVTLMVQKFIYKKSASSIR